MKYVLIGIVAVALGWVGVIRLKKSPQPPVAAAAASPAVPPSPAKVATTSPSPTATTPPSPASSVTKPLPLPAVSTPAVASPKAAPALPPPPSWQVQSSFVEPTKPSALPAALPPIALTDVLGPNNLYHDDAFGVSATYPEGWTVGGAGRWGANNSENTVSLVPDTPTTARPSMYYQLYPNGYPEVEGSEAYFRRVAQNKENQRVAGGVTDYKNLPGSFEFTEINGNPAVSYFAAFNRGDEVQTEYFVRILGKKGYVMFFVPGRMEDVQAIMPQLRQMASTVKVP